MVAAVEELRWRYFVSLWSGPEKMVKQVEVRDIREADELVKAEISREPGWRATIYPRQEAREGQ